MKKNNTSMNENYGFSDLPHCPGSGILFVSVGKKQDRTAGGHYVRVDTALSRDLTNNYPATPKEVIRYYNDLIKCFYNEDCTTEELQELGRKSLQLFDEELRANNEEDTYLTRLQGEVKNYKDNKRKITSVSLASKHQCGLLYSRRIFFCPDCLWLWHDGKRKKEFHHAGISASQG